MVNVKYCQVLNFQWCEFSMLLPDYVIFFAKPAKSLVSRQFLQSTEEIIKLCAVTTVSMSQFFVVLNYLTFLFYQRLSHVKHTFGKYCFICTKSLMVHDTDWTQSVAASTLILLCHAPPYLVSHLGDDRELMGFELQCQNALIKWWTIYLLFTD